MSTVQRSLGKPLGDL